MTSLFGPVQVAPAEESQREGILRLQRVAIDKLPHGLYAPKVREAWWRWPAQDLDGLIEAGRYIVVSLEGYLVAGAGWTPEDPPGTALMRAVYTDPDFAGLWFGRLPEDRASCSAARPNERLVRVA